ncbi:TIGR02117 family protein [Hoeflea sp. YIM 152468]|uniref:TIGR02117 family protein n=1 Tax=Hoeflea sp. YIM 152468 TaxID=3031759 RepID=UPI0023DBC294|nr:TIGR02117 family protein [Hoeflea sp. YIM 152468]MDF1610030.1 TIGR02117 family protein [Hoeflea sp. YIM 152468]
MLVAMGVVILLLGLGTAVPRPGAVAGPTASTPASTIAPSVAAKRTVLLLSSAIHTDIALPADPDVTARFGFMAADGLDPSQPGVAHIIAGWGGRSFYIETPTWADLKPGPVFSALTLDSSVMHMGLAGPLNPADASVMTLEFDAAAFDRLIDSILASFAVNAEGAPVRIEDAGYGAYDRFYEAKGGFNAFVGCNVWTARMLRQAGLKTGWWTPLPGLLGTSLRVHNPQSLQGVF